MTRTMRASLLLGCVLGLPVLAGTPVGWRGDGTGQFRDTTPPSEWSAEKNVRWKVALPGSSYGAPIVVGDNLLVVSDPADLLCVRRSDGKVLWRKSASDVKAPAAKGGGPGGRFGGRGGRGGPGGRGGRGGMGGKSGNTAATPASDGKHVALVLGNGVVAAHDLEGKRLWAKFVESPQVGFGHAASPLLLDGKVIVHIKDLVALDVATGKEAWRAQLRASHASPVATRLGNEDLVVSPTGAILRARDGKVLARGKFHSTQSSPVVSGDIVCVCGRDSMAAVRLARNDKGEITVTSLWELDGSRERHHLPSPLIHDGLVYVPSTNGFLSVLELKTGKSVYRQRLGLGQIYSSVSMAGGLLYVADLRGKAVVFKPGRTFQRVALNQLEGTGSCPVFAGDALYLRGQKNLYCLGAKEGDSATKKE